MNSQKLKGLLERINRVGKEIVEIEADFAEELRQTEGPAEGLVFADLLTMPDALRQVVLEIRQQEEASLAQLADTLGVNKETLEAQLQILVQQGHVTESRRAGRIVYRVVMGAKRPAQVPDIWGALEQRIEQAA